MKEFNAHAGGRYTYADDILNLQELALAFSEIFNECPGFVLSGCEVSGTNISSGYIYLNKKIRHFSGAANITTWPQYLYESNKSENVTYESGSENVGRIIYGCKISQTLITSPDPVTKQPPVCISLTSTGGPKMKDVFLGRYAVLLNGAASKQTINGNLNVSESFTADGTIESKKSISVNNGGSIISLSANQEFAQISIKMSTGKKYDFKTTASGIDFSVNDKVLLTIGDNEIKVSGKLTAQEGEVGTVSIKSSNIFNKQTVGDEGYINVNMIGYQGGKNNFRNFVVGDGKGAAIMSVIGAQKAVNINGKVTIDDNTGVGLIFRNNHLKNDNGYLSAFVWYDSENFNMGHIGYTSTKDQDLRIINNVSNITLHAQRLVDCYPAIAENGQKLSDKYVLKSVYDKAIADKANSIDVYTQSESKELFAQKALGLTQFITSKHTTKNLCDDIQAIHKSDIKDTGWLNIAGTSLYVRQYGNIVCIEGSTTIQGDDYLFTLPDEIDAPKYNVRFTFGYDNRSASESHTWSIRIDGGQKKAYGAAYQGGKKSPIAVCMTYMI